MAVCESPPWKSEVEGKFRDHCLVPQASSKESHILKWVTELGPQTHISYLFFYPVTQTVAETAVTRFGAKKSTWVQSHFNLALTKSTKKVCSLSLGTQMSHSPLFRPVHGPPQLTSVLWPLLYRATLGEALSFNGSALHLKTPPYCRLKGASGRGEEESAGWMGRWHG